MAHLPRATWLAPVAVFGGAASSGAAFARPGWMLTLAMAMLLSLAWVGVWSTIASVNWSAPLSLWQRWTQGAPLRTLPYTQPDSDAAYVSLRIGQLVNWLERELLPRYGAILLLGLMGLAIMIVLAAALGPAATLLAIGVICLAQVAVVACRGDGAPNAFLEGATVVGLPMLLGAATFAPVTPDVWLVSVAMAIASAGIRAGAPRMRNAGYVLAILAATLTRQPIGAFALAVLWAPQLILNLPRNNYGWLAIGLLAFAVVRAAAG
ncbi:MAG: hypothetical protein D6709_01160 [Chloroflexi bacterium]|uniref:Uncharacterized protein n=1 Tax=Candidatus Thermofonsia Clade 3 bacterium TaxID=2364212 RepID=A0A2M8QC52_9CHLR|nr:MAG: hypothetical protein CUN48_09005 [Candidatus Thermofonsia Clade 3 bacterium]RMG65944.1 MAG: hypothetical protein D6709_01160 [Chloroflexota bacterium]